MVALLLMAAATLLAPLAGPVAAEEEASDDGPLISLHNDLRYTVASRLARRDPALVAPLNWGDGDGNFGRGLISNRLDLLSSVDVDLAQWGAHVSGAAWYDSVYRQGTDADPGAELNSATQPGRFPAATRRRQGRDGELREAFVRGRFDLGEVPVSVRVGRQILAWGEGLFHDPQSIAAAQTPVDYTRAIAPPGAYRSDIYRPVAQAVLTLQPRPDLAVSVYDQFEWRRTLLAGSGSYFSYLDHLGPGGDRLLLTPDRYLVRRPDRDHSAKAQFGLSVHFNAGEVDFGLYALRYNSSEPQYFSRGDDLERVAGPVGIYRVVYPGNSRLYGASASTVIADTTLAGEVSLRDNAPLLRPIANLPDLDEGPYIGYVRGDTLHGQLSLSSAIGRTSLWDSADLNGEAAFDQVLRNERVDGPRPRRQLASHVRLLLEPHYFRVLPNVDVTLPLGLGYNLSGRSFTYRVQNAGGGDMQVGIAATYQSVWKANLTLTRYLGSPRQQWLADRDFLAFSLERAF